VNDAILRRVRPEQFREVILLVVTVGLLLFFASQIPNYFDPRSVNRLTTGLAITLVVAVGQVLVVLTRNIDLSVSSTVGLTAYVVGTLLTRSQDMPPLVAIVLAMAIGLALGSINGLIVAYGGVPAIIATLGTLALYRVVLVEFSGAKTVTTADLPDWLNDVPSATVLSAGGYDLRLMVAIALLVALLGQLTLRYLPFGRRLYAIGSNPEAARTAGLPVQRTVFTAFAICGALSGLAALGATATVVNAVVRPLGRRRRPDVSERQESRYVRLPSSRSFPSGHSAGAFAFATGVAHVMPRTGVALRGLAALVAYSRVHTGVHYPVDAMAGALLGTAIAQLTSHALARREAR